jgi:hypothetical protein
LLWCITSNLVASNGPHAAFYGLESSSSSARAFRSTGILEPLGAILASWTRQAGFGHCYEAAGDDPHAIAIASSLIREIGFEPVVVGGLAMGKYLVPGTPLGGVHTAAEIRQALTSLH